MSRLRPIYTKQLGSCRIARHDPHIPFRFFLTFYATRKPGGGEDRGREVVAVMDAHEVAAVLGSIPRHVLEPGELGTMCSAITALHRIGSMER